MPILKAGRPMTRSCSLGESPLIARNLNDLVNTTLVQNLNPPVTPQLANADWIKPGRSTWQWLAIGDPQEQDQHQWVDWTSQIGFEYYLLDEGWEKWPDSWSSGRLYCCLCKDEKRQSLDMGAQPFRE